MRVRWWLVFHRGPTSLPTTWLRTEAPLPPASRTTRVSASLILGSMHLGTSPCAAPSAQGRIQSLSDFFSGLLVGISRTSSMNFWDLRSASEPVFSSPSNTTTQPSTQRSTLLSPLVTVPSKVSAKRKRYVPPSDARENVQNCGDERGEDQDTEKEARLDKRRRLDKTNFAEAMGSLRPRNAAVRREGVSSARKQEAEQRRLQKEARRRFYLHPTQTFDLPPARSAFFSPFLFLENCNSKLTILSISMWWCPKSGATTVAFR